MPPPSHALAGEFRRIPTLTEIDVADIAIQVVDPEGSDLSQFLDQPVMVINMARLAFRTILGTGILKVAKILFFLAIN